MTRIPGTRLRLLRAVAALVLPLGLAAGCANDTDSSAGGDESTDSPDGSYPMDVQVGDDTVTLEEEPSQIIVLGPSLTETVYAVGAGDQVLAVDQLSNYPGDAPVSDLDSFAPNVESIISMEPDLVLVSDDMNDVVAGLSAADIPTALLEAPETLDEAYEQFETVGELTGHASEGADLASEVAEGIDAAADSASTTDTALTYYWELDPTYYSVTSETFIGSILEKFGLENIADKAQDTAGGYPQLSAEYIIDADPDLIFLADSACCGQNAESVQQRPGWDVTRAVKEGSIAALDDDIASRWGPRLVDLAEEIAETVEKATA